jgi:hypothetical protein
MDIVFLSVTVASLAIAAVMSVVAWRMSSENRARSAARIAALAAAAHDQAPTGDTLMSIPAPVAAVLPTPVAPLTPPAATASPWLAPTLKTRVVTRLTDRDVHFQQDRDLEKPAEPGTAVGGSFLGSAVAAPSSSGRQRGLAIAASVLFVALVTAGYLTVFGDDATDQRTAAAATAASAAPLELISLRHERKQGTLAITGLVRNPGAGQMVDKLDAVAFLFDQQGGFLSSARTGVDYTQLAPGDESPFVIRVDAPSTVARYRVSFRTEAGVVPHVDRRGQEPIARDLP